MRCSRPSWPRRSAMLCDSDLPLRLMYAPSFTLPASNGTGPPSDECAVVAPALGDADPSGVADADADGRAVAVAGPTLALGAPLVVAPVLGVARGGAASAPRRAVEQAAGRVASAARVSSPRRGSRGLPDDGAVMVLLACGRFRGRGYPAEKHKYVVGDHLPTTFCAILVFL
ncbi:hypothetical protein KRMM14A1259_24220 [Krasilnikovia sp. MM14-A1259]